MVSVVLHEPETRVVYPTLPVAPSDAAFMRKSQYSPVFPSTIMLPQSLSETTKLGVSVCVFLSEESRAKTPYWLVPEIS